MYCNVSHYNRKKIYPLLYQKQKKENWNFGHTIWWCQNQEWLSGVTMALKVINKINGWLKFLYRKNRYLTPYLKQLLCNALIQPHFDYVNWAWYPNLNKKFKSKLQTVQNKSIRYCLQLDNRSHIGMIDFEKTDWFPVSERFNQYLCSNAYKFLKTTCPLYFHDNIDNLVKIKQIRDLLFWN